VPRRGAGAAAMPGQPWDWGPLLAQEQVGENPVLQPAAQEPVGRARCCRAADLSGVLGFYLFYRAPASTAEAKGQGRQLARDGFGSRS
jgi:hypothetical protein